MVIAVTPPSLENKYVFIMASQVTILDLVISYNFNKLFCPHTKMSTSEFGINYAVKVRQRTQMEYLLPNLELDILVLGQKKFVVVMNYCQLKKCYLGYKIAYKMLNLHQFLFDSK